jgi:anaerobic ribonucleoside-triphosphate reductase activating protein
MTVEQIMRVIEADPFTRGVTFSGGDPMYQAAGFAELARQIHRRTQKDIWCYTGFTYEKLVSNPRQRALLQEIDVLVDGPFLKAERDETLRFRGSRNQRIIDVPASLSAGRAVNFSYQF